MSRDWAPDELYTIDGEELVRPEHLPAYAVIIRSIHQRGQDQANCLAELDRRGLWLTEDQKIAAGLACRLPRSLLPVEPGAE